MNLAAIHPKLGLQQTSTRATPPQNPYFSRKSPPPLSKQSRSATGTKKNSITLKLNRS